MFKNSVRIKKHTCLRVDAMYDDNLKHKSGINYSDVKSLNLVKKG